MLLSVTQASDWTWDLAGEQIRDMKQLREFVAPGNSHSGKEFVFIKFINVMCKPCERDMPLWNEAVDIINEKYKGKCIFLKVDGRN